MSRHADGVGSQEEAAVLAADPFFIVFRFFHIVFGAFWFGAATMFAAFIGPAAGEVGPAAGPILSNLVKKRRLATVITGSATLTVAAGLIMYLKDASDRGWGAWISSGTGIVFTIGALAAIGAYVEGYLHIGRNVERLVSIGDRVATAEGPPPPEDLMEMGRLQEAIKRASQIDLVLLVIAVGAMATARYW
jgi:small-conductance mechanosensitive channel